MGTQPEHVLLLLANSFTVVLVAWFGLNGTVVLYVHMHTQRHEAQTVTLMALSTRFRSGRLLSSRVLLDMHAKIEKYDPFLLHMHILEDMDYFLPEIAF